eukprot:scaffold42630_cov33-Prasinocladus_malaysianus.AAC.1
MLRNNPAIAAASGRDVEDCTGASGVANGDPWDRLEAPWALVLPYVNASVDRWVARAFGNTS